ncbi:MAG TPA: 4-hydroxythreonine-4-phosphate dehydrogenase PdxA [Pyrinomonadaceae bacterium]|nr:4-hydroxythreonine-4-phosphate dehydrogenase PdxA [Pyrinomonadaceae bacterium]
MLEGAGHRIESGSEPPRVAITVGDPAGIGPEIVLKAIVDADVRRSSRIVLVGSETLLRSTAAQLGLSLKFKPYSTKAGDADHIFINDPGGLPAKTAPGIESADTGKAAALCIETAVAMWKNGEIDAIATAPISKNALAMAGYKYPGHTEFLAELTNTREFAMSFFADKLRVVLLSTHCSLLDAIAKVKTDALVDLIKFTERSMRELLRRNVRLAVAGLNPHASEGGMFGSEEADEITPAIEICRSQHGIDVSGPYSPDTIFLRGFRGEFDAVVACYHDQATIAVKSLSFGSAVNVTLGLPLIRTSVDHGTAFDIAGKGVADESSMKAAIRLAADLVTCSKGSIS